MKPIHQKLLSHLIQACNGFFLFIDNQKKILSVWQNYTIKEMDRLLASRYLSIIISNIRIICGPEVG